MVAGMSDKLYAQVQLGKIEQLSRDLAAARLDYSAVRTENDEVHRDNDQLTQRCIELENDLAAARRDYDELTTRLADTRGALAAARREAEEVQARTVGECAKIFHVTTEWLSLELARIRALAPLREPQGASTGSAVCDKCGETYLTNWAHICGELNPDKAFPRRNDPLSPEEGRVLTWALENGWAHVDLTRLGLQALAKELGK